MADTDIHRMASNKILDHVIDKVKSFYEQPDISWVSPGRKDCMTVVQDGTKKKIQKQYLMTTIREAHALFCDKYANVKISFSKFADLRPKHICLYSKFPHNVCLCLCRYHENVHLLVVALKEKFPEIPTGFKEFIGTIVCNQDSELCMFADCGNCKECTPTWNR